MFQEEDTRKKIPEGTKLPVYFTPEEHELILENAFVEPEAFGLGVSEGERLRFDLSLDDIEYIQGYVAAAANHSKNKKIEKRLRMIFSYLQSFLDSYDDQWMLR